MDRGRLGWTRNLVRVDRWWNGLASSERGRPRLYMWSVAFRGDQGCDLRSSINQPSGGAVVWTLDVTPRRRVASMPRNETVRLAVASRARGMRNGRRKVRRVSNLSTEPRAPSHGMGSGGPSEGSGCRQTSRCAQPFRESGWSGCRRGYHCPACCDLYIYCYIY
jgi:hypothetical protein